MTKQETLPKGVGVAKVELHQNIYKSINFTCKGIISLILDYNSQ